MSLITTSEVTGVYNQWNIRVYDYEVQDGLKKLKCEDFQDLVTNISTRRASGIEIEITAMAKLMEKRNQKLDYLSTLLADMGKVAAKIDPDSDSGNQYINMPEGWSAGTLEALKILSKGSYTIVSNELLVWIGSYSGRWVITGSDGIRQATYEFINHLGKSTVDALNNDAQSDMVRLQSLVSKRDESYSNATSLLTAVSDTRSNLIKNF